MEYFEGITVQTSNASEQKVLQPRLDDRAQTQLLSPTYYHQIIIGGPPCIEVAPLTPFTFTVAVVRARYGLA